MAEIEPRILTEDVQRVLRLVVRTGEENEGESVTVVAEKADTSTRTVYRVLARTTESISLDLGDRLCIAAGSHPRECRLLWPDGLITDYSYLPSDAEVDGASE